MCAELADLNHSAVPFLSRAAINLSWYDITLYGIQCIIHITHIATAKITARKYSPRAV